MKIKLIAIGNPMMKDDGVGIRIATYLENYLQAHNIQVIIGETDLYYCLEQIKDGDDVIIIDATYEQEAVPGSILVLPLEKICLNSEICFTQHQTNLIKGLSIYKRVVKGIFIGVEVEDFSFGLELSEKIEQLLPQICEKVKECIQTYVRRHINA